MEVCEIVAASIVLKSTGFISTLVPPDHCYYFEERIIHLYLASVEFF